MDRRANPGDELRAARDPLRARVPRGFRVDKTDHAARLVWGGPFGLAVLIALVLWVLFGFGF